MNGQATKFLACKRGNIAIFGAASLAPLLLAAGITLDYSTILRKKTEFQQTLDSAVLAIARKGGGLTKKRKRQIATKFLNSNFDGNYSELRAFYTGTAVTVSATLSPDLVFTDLIKQQPYKLALRSTADTAPSAFEIALVLDTTGSMKGGKLAAMKDAVRKLVTDLKTQMNRPDGTRIAVVPFSSFVNVGPQYGAQFGTKGEITRKAATWLDSKGNSPIAQSDLPEGLGRFALYHHLDAEWPGCVETRPEIGSRDLGIDDTPPDPSKPETLFIPSFSIDEPDDPGRYPNSYLKDLDAAAGAGSVEERIARYGIPASAIRPDGDIDGDDDDDDDDRIGWTKVTQDDSFATFYGPDTVRKGPKYGCEVEPLLDLTSDPGAVLAKIKSLRARGSTNTTEGVMWGWRVLSPGEPFTAGAPKASDTRKIMVVLTDGANSFGNLPNALGSGYSSYGYLVDGRLGITAGGQTATTKRLNDKTRQTCQNAKADGIEIFTIRLEEPDVSTGTMLSECASSPEHYYDTQ